MAKESERDALAQRLSNLSAEQRASLKLKVQGRRRRVLRTFATRGPLSFSQLRQWFLDQLEPGNPTYNSPMAVRLFGRFDGQAFEQALNRVIAGHELLRTRFSRDATGPVQIVEPELCIELERIELPDRSQLDEALRRTANLSFDLSRLPLVRARLFRLAPEEHALLVVTHHIISDGWSLGVFVKELVHYYYGGAAISPEVQYLDYVGWERSRFGSASLNEELAWWTEQLKGAPLGHFLPLDRERPAAESHRGAKLQLELPRELGDRLSRAASAHNTTLFVLFVAGLSALLSRWSTIPEFLLGTPVANRATQELEGLIGLFVNTVVLRMDVSGNPRLKELVLRTKRTVEAGLSRQNVPFEKIVEALNPQRQKAHDALFQVMVTYFNEPTRAHLDFPELRWEPIDFDRGYAYRDLTFRVGELQQKFLVDIEYKTDLFDSSTIEALARHLLAVLRELVEHPERPLSDLDVALPARRRSDEAPPVWAHVGRTLLQQALRRSPVPLDLEPEPVRRMNPLDSAEWPLLLCPGSRDVDLAGWFERNRERVDALLLRHGAILWRGFAVQSAQDLARVVGRLGDRVILDYSEASTPRTKLESGVFTSTEYPPDQTIRLHNEGAYLSRWPGRLFFCCEKPAQRGGATTLGNMRTIYGRIDPAVRAEFERKGVQYQRNFHPGVDLSWQEVYQTDDKTRVEEIARLDGVELTWRSDGGLSTRRRLPALMLHPETKDPIWFNSAHMFHVAGHKPALRDSLRSLFGDLLPRHAHYGDGSVIPDYVIEHICDVLRVHVHPVRWRAGDLLMIDNLLTLHGREPFEGSRSILVMMTEPQTAGALSAVG